jgi:hypothetical protein
MEWVLVAELLILSLLLQTELNAHFCLRFCQLEQQHRGQIPLCLKLRSLSGVLAVAHWSVKKTSVQ